MPFQVGIPPPSKTFLTNINNYLSLSSAIDSIGTDEKTLFIPDEQPVTVDVTIPSNITLKFLQGGSLNIDAGVTVTINGHIEAGLYQIFSGAGSVDFVAGSVKEVYPQWWGENTIPGTTDFTEEIKAAIAALVGLEGAMLYIPKSDYLITDTLDFSALNTGQKEPNYTLDFGGSKFIWDGDTDKPIFLFYNNVQNNIELKHFILDGMSTAGSKGIFLDSLAPYDCSNIKISFFEIYDCAIGMELGSETGGQQNRITNVITENFLIQGCTTGVKMNSGNVDMDEFNNGILGGCTTCFDFTRCGHLAFKDVYGQNADDFILINGPHGSLNFKNCAAEGAGNFFRQAVYDGTNKYNPIRFDSCTLDLPVVFDAGDSAGQRVIFDSCDIDADITVNGNNLYIVAENSFIRTLNTILLAGSGSSLLNISSKIEATVTVTGFNARNIKPVPLLHSNEITTDNSVSGNYSPSISDSNTFYLTLTGNASIKNPIPANKGELNQLLIFVLKQDATGGRTVSWDTMYLTSWTPDTAANKTNVITFRKISASIWVQVGAETGL